MNGAHVLIKTLESLGVRKIFGYPGGQVLPIYDALLDAKKLDHILVRHEQVAAHAADAYARVTGKPGVCLATSGPGATNLVTGIANAYMDSIPIIAITGQVPTPVIGTDAFQEADITGITLPIVKHSYLVKDARDLSKIVKEAYYIASTGRPGPVLIDIPRDVAQQPVEYKENVSINLPGFKPTTKGHAKQIKQAAKTIFNSNKPVMYVGGGAMSSDAGTEVTKLAKMLKIPVTNTLMAKGIFDENDDLSLGLLGMHGTVYANYAMTYSDLIIAVGARFDDRVTGKIKAFAPGAKVIHIDIDPAEISKTIPATIPIVGDVKAVLKQLIEEIKNMKKSSKPADKSAWFKQVSDWKADHPLKYKMGKSVKPQYVVEVINKLTKGRKTVVTTGVGQNQMFAALYYKNAKPRTFVSSGGLGTMGFGLPAAIGAQVGQPDALVIDIDGDGSLQMVSQDIATAVCKNLPINIIILNNGYLGMVRQWQQLFYKKRYSHVDICVGTPDFVKLADAYGALGIRVSKPNEVEPALKKAFASKKTVVVDILVEREENVFPMVAPGAAINEILTSE